MLKLGQAIFVIFKELFKIKIASGAEGQSYKTGCALSINWSHTDQKTCIITSCLAPYYTARKFVEPSGRKIVKNGKN